MNRVSFWILRTDHIISLLPPKNYPPELHLPNLSLQARPTKYETFSLRVAFFGRLSQLLPTLFCLSTLINTSFGAFIHFYFSFSLPKHLSVPVTHYCFLIVYFQTFEPFSTDRIYSLLHFISTEAQDRPQSIHREIQINREHQHHRNTVAILSNPNWRTERVE